MHAQHTLYPGVVNRQPQKCNCNKHVSSCPAARQFTFGLSDLKFRKREAARRKLRARAPKDLLWLLRVGFKDRCEMCGRRDCDWTIERIIPGAKGGDYSPGNVTLACRSCNSRKASHDFMGPVRSFADIGGFYV